MDSTSRWSETRPAIGLRRGFAIRSASPLGSFRYQSFGTDLARREPPLSPNRARSRSERAPTPTQSQRSRDRAASEPPAATQSQRSRDREASEPSVAAQRPPPPLLFPRSQHLARSQRRQLHAPRRRGRIVAPAAHHHHSPTGSGVEPKRRHNPEVTGSSPPPHCTKKRADG